MGFVRKVDVVNRGFSGYNTRMLASVLPHVGSEGADLAAVVLLMGANDSNDENINPRQAVPLDEFRNKMRDIVEYFVRVGVERRKIVVVSPPPVDVERWHAYLKERDGEANVPVCPKSQENTKQFAEGCRTVAVETGVSFVPLYDAIMSRLSLEEGLSDGPHLSKSGNKLLYELLEPLLEERLSHLDIRFPDWKEMDNSDTDKSCRDWIEGRRKKVNIGKHYHHQQQHD